LIERIVAACPDAAAIPNNDGNCPLHLGMMFSAPAQSIEAVINAHPAACRRKNVSGYLKIGAITGFDGGSYLPT